jgi:hypothetical protein
VITKTDFLDVYDPIVYRIIRFYNPENDERTVSLASLIDVNFYSNRVGDSAFYDPELKGLVAYKSSRYLTLKAFAPTVATLVTP